MTLLNTTAADKLLDDMSAYKELCKSFITQEVLRSSPCTLKHLKPPALLWQDCVNGHLCMKPVARRSEIHVTWSFTNRAALLSQPAGEVSPEPCTPCRSSGGRCSLRGILVR